MSDDVMRQFPKRARAILGALDASAMGYVLPMLDHGYLYLAATRMSLFRSERHWAVVFEVFGFSPRVGVPDLWVTTIDGEIDASGSSADDRHGRHPKAQTFRPVPDGDWIDVEDPERVAAEGRLVLRGREMPLPERGAYAAAGIDLLEARPLVFELCRYLAAMHREEVLATEAERRGNIAPDMAQVMVLDDWHHPDLAGGELPGDTETFRQLAEVLATGDASIYTAPETGNTHWRNWPEGGRL
uniref:DUF7003 family protein n=1 Tax=Roseovarius indicus TaxID=540747 RepID=UPI003B52815D